MVDDLAKKPKKKRGKMPTQRTLEHCRERGWIIGVVELTIPHTFLKRDLFGVYDLIGISPEGQICGIQAKGMQGVSAGVATFKENLEVIAAWEKAGGHSLVVAWRKIKVKTQKGTTLDRWKPRWVEIDSTGEETEIEDF
jgi:hypothetical protein